MPRRRMPHDELNPSTQYRYGDHSEVPRIAHAQQSREWRRSIALAEMAPIEGRLIGLIASGVAMRQACEECGTTLGRVQGRAKWDRAWRMRLDAALMAGRDPSLEHGRAGTYARYRCRCPECREAHDATRRSRSDRVVSAAQMEGARRQAAALRESYVRRGGSPERVM